MGHRIEDSLDAPGEGRDGDAFVQAPADHETRNGGGYSRNVDTLSVRRGRAGAKLMYQNDRVLRVMVVTDSLGSFVEWIER